MDIAQLRPLRHANPQCCKPVRQPLKVCAASTFNDGEQAREKGGRGAFQSPLRAFAALIGSNGANNIGNNNSTNTQASSRRGAASSADPSVDVSSLNRLRPTPDVLNRLSSNAHPSVIAAALVASRDSVQPKNEFPRDMDSQNEPSVQFTSSEPVQLINSYSSDGNQKSQAGVEKNGGPGTPNNNNNNNNNNGGHGKEETGMTMSSPAELEAMLAGLRASLDSIQESRMKYVQTITERDQTIQDLQGQLDSANRTLQEQSIQLAELKGQLAASQQAEAAARQQAQAVEQALQSARNAVAARTAAPPSPASQPLSPPTPRRSPSPPPPPSTYSPASATARTRTPSPPPRATPPPPPPPPVGEVTLYYRTGWKQAFLHCCMDGKAWTQAPGIPLEQSGGDIKMIKLPCSKLEFVVTNGKGDWDSPPGNYKLDGPGTYRLEFGKIHKH